MTVEAQQQNADFLAGFAGVQSGETSAPPAAKPAEDAKPEGDEVAEQPKDEAPKGEDQGGGDGEAQADLIAGFTQEEMRNMLARAAKADALEKEVRKLHGKFGELNGFVQEMRSKEKAPAKTPELPPELAQFEQDYSEVAAYVKAMVPKAPEQPSEPAAQAQEAPAGDEQEHAVQLALMDHLHKGWREKVSGQDFQLWLSTQSDDVRQTHDSASTAAEFSEMLGKFDAWTSGKESRNTKSKQRLEQALTPTGSAGKPKTAPTPRDEFLAGFKSVMGQRA